MDDAEVCESWEQIGDNTELLDRQLEKIKIERRTFPESSGANGVLTNSTATTASSGPTVMKILTRKDNQDLLLRGNNNTTNTLKLTATTTNPMAMASAPSTDIVLDSTNPDSLRTQYVPPQPKLKILSRPKPNARGNSECADQNGVMKKPQKSLQQREQEYAEARMRILGDVRFPKEEKEAELEAMLSPAEILKLKISEAMQGEVQVPPTTTSSSGDSDNPTAAAATDSSLAPVSSTSTSKCKNSKRKNKNRGKSSSSSPSVNSESPRAPKDFPVSKADSEHIHRQPRGPDGTKGFNTVAKS